MDYAVVKTLQKVVGLVSTLDAFAAFCAAVLPYLVVIGFMGAVFFLFPRDLSPSLAYQKQRLQFILTTGLALLVGRGIVVSIIRFIYPVVRPFAALHFTPLIAHAADDPSFPSGHATVLFALATAVWFKNKRWGIYLYIGAVINAVARVYVGVHWPSDVIAGALIGIGAVYAVHKAIAYRS